MVNAGLLKYSPRMSHKNKNLFGLIILPFLLAAGCCMGQIRYFVQPAIPLEQADIRFFLAASQDSIANDTLFQVLSKEGYPVSYFRKIRTSVCFDNKCRLLKCVLYWNITGRYLGFELPKGEFLSKAEHKPFTLAEYERLGNLLADQQSPLGMLSYDELAPQVKPTVSADGEVDGISSATAKNVLEYVVEGAAYTTYKMWHVVYGPTQEDIIRLTRNSLTADLILKILESPDLNDRIWALNQVRGGVKMTSGLREKLFSLINDANYNMAERAISAFNGADLASDAIQLSLLEKFDVSGYAIKKLIIGKFIEVPFLGARAKKKLVSDLQLMTGELVSNVLETFAKHKITDTETCRAISVLLVNPNTFISQKAFRYLEQVDIKDAVVQKRLDEYRLKK